MVYADSGITSIDDMANLSVCVLSGTTTQFVAVTPGLFADGLVEVDGIAPGTTVVVP